MSDGYRFHVDRTGILLFASALGETNPIYYDDEYAEQTPLGGVVAPPTYPTACHHWSPNNVFRGVRRIPPPPARKQEAEAKSKGEKSGEAVGGASLARVLHGEQRFEYHKAFQPGMELVITSRPGKSWTKEGRRGGALKFTEVITEYREPDGELVCTATSVGIQTEKAVES